MVWFLCLVSRSSSCCRTWRFPPPAFRSHFSYLHHRCRSPVCRRLHLRRQEAAHVGFGEGRGVRAKKKHLGEEIRTRKRGEGGGGSGRALQKVTVSTSNKVNT